jgi:hypothetical protein
MKRLVKSFDDFINEQATSVNDLYHLFKKYNFEIDRNIDGLFLQVGPVELIIRHKDMNEGIEDTTLIITLEDNSIILVGEEKIKKVLDDGLIKKIENFEDNPSALDKYLQKMGFETI